MSQPGRALIAAQGLAGIARFVKGDAFDRDSLAAIEPPPDARHRLRALRAFRRQRDGAALARRPGRRDPAGRLSDLHRPALASAARADRPRADQPSRRPGLGHAPAHAGRDGPARRRRRLPRSSSSASTNGASSPCRSPSGSEAGLSSAAAIPLTAPRQRHGHGAAPLPGSPARTLLLRQLRRGELAGGTARRRVGAIVFAWEHSIPFVPWTIVPYWSIDALLRAVAVRLHQQSRTRYACAPAADRADRGRRVLHPVSASLQLRSAGDRGLDGLLFAALTSFDKPFNQAPSLHIALLVHHLGAVCPARAALGAVADAAVVCGRAVSVLTTYQHHFIDVPTGALLGFLCLWLWPDGRPSPLAQVSLHPRAQAARPGDALRALAPPLWRIAGIALGGAALWLLWPAVSLALVAANYAVFGAGGFQKGPDGRMSSGGARAFPALSDRRLDQFAPVDPP